MLPVAAAQALIALVAEIGRVLLPVRGVEPGQAGVTELKLHLAAPGDAHRVVARLLWKERAHLLLAFQIELVGREFHPILVLNGVVGLDAQQDAVHPAVLPFDIMAVIRRHKRNPRLLRQSEKLRIDELLLADPVILKLQKEIPVPENLLIAQGGLFGRGVIVRGKLPRNLPRKAGRKRDQAFAVLLQKLRVDARLAVEALDPRFRNQRHQILIAGVVFAEQHQMIRLRIQLVDPVEARAARHIDLAPDDRLDPVLFRRAVKIDHAVHDAVVGDGDGLLPLPAHGFHQAADPAGSVQQAVFRMKMQMNESAHDSPLLKALSDSPRFSGSG